MKTLRDFISHADKTKKNSGVEEIRNILQSTPEKTDEEKLVSFLKSKNIIPIDDYAAVVQNLQPGDVIAIYSYENTSKINAAIRTGQYFVKPFLKHTTSDSHNATHLMIVVSVDKEKNIVKVAEADMDSKKHEVRTVSFRHEDFHLPNQKFREYRVYRSDSPALRSRMAEVAQYFAEEKVHVDEESGKERGFFTAPTRHHYSKKKAVKSLFKRADFSAKSAEKAKRQADAFLKSKSKKPPTQDDSLLRFFCAEFIGFTYLTAEISLEQEKLEGQPLPTGWQDKLINRIRASRMTPQKFIGEHRPLKFTETVHIIPGFKSL